MMAFEWVWAWWKSKGKLSRARATFYLKCPDAVTGALQGKCLLLQDVGVLLAVHNYSHVDIVIGMGYLVGNCMGRRAQQYRSQIIEGVFRPHAANVALSRTLDASTGNRAGTEVE